MSACGVDINLVGQSGGGCLCSMNLKKGGCALCGSAGGASKVFYKGYYYKVHLDAKTGNKYILTKDGRVSMFRVKQFQKKLRSSK